MSRDKYSVIIPTYNEKDNLPIMVFLLDEVFTKHALDYEIIIVDDNSQDGTGLIADTLAAHPKWAPSVKVLHRAGKLGLGTAYMEGLGLCTGTHIFLMDSDLSHQAKYIPEFIAKMKSTKCDIVSGTRYQDRGGVIGWSLFRFLTSQVANFLADTSLGIGQTDLTGSFRLYKRGTFEKIVKQMFSTGYAFQMEILCRAKELGLRVEEVPIVFVERVYQETKFSGGEIKGFLYGVVRLFSHF
jgi:dolichol-phosphate mannosyltransferase